MASSLRVSSGRRALFLAIIFIGAPPRPPAAPLVLPDVAAVRRLLGVATTVGTDDLQEVVSPLPYPYSALGLLVFDEPAPGSATQRTGDQRPGAELSPGGGGGEQRDDLSICTGFMISQDTVLTAAHCLYTVEDPGHPNRRQGYRRVLGFYPSYSRTNAGAGYAPLGNVPALWSAVPHEWIDYASQGTFLWREDVGVVRLERTVGLTTGWFGLAVGCDIASTTLLGRAKERASSAASEASSAAADISLAGFPGASMVTGTRGQRYFPLMGDQHCRVSGAALCPSDAGGTSRTSGMLQHRCDTGNGMSGAPLWLHAGTTEAHVAESFAAGEGMRGYRPETRMSAARAAAYGLAPLDAEGRPEPAAVAVGVVSRHTGDCPWGEDCVNQAAPMDAATLGIIRELVLRA